MREIHEKLKVNHIIYVLEYPFVVIVDNLCAMFGCKLFDRLDFENYIFKTQEVRHIFLLQLLTFVPKSESGLFQKWDFLLGQFDAQTFMVHGF